MCREETQFCFCCLVSTPQEAPVEHGANKFSRNHIKQTQCAIDCQNDITLSSSEIFPSLTEDAKYGREIFIPVRSSFRRSCQCSFSFLRPSSISLPHANTYAHRAALVYRGIFNSPSVRDKSFHISLLETAKTIYETITLESQMRVEKLLTHSRGER